MAMRYMTLVCLEYVIKFLRNLFLLCMQFMSQFDTFFILNLQHLKDTTLPVLSEFHMEFDVCQDGSHTSPPCSTHTNNSQ